MKFFYPSLVIYALLLLGGCKEPRLHLSDAEILHENQDQLTQIIIYDIFTPPVVSRIYAYSSLASYEAIRFARPDGNPSIAAKLNGFYPIPQPERGKKYNYALAASKAFFSVVHTMVFSIDSLKDYENNLYAAFKDQTDEETFNRSVVFGENVGKAILKRASGDGYSASRGKPKYLGSEQPGKWRPTPPDYMDGVEWCWNTMKTFALDSSAECKPPEPLVYSTDTNSAFYREVYEVYSVSKNLTEEKKTIARYWDDNPFVMEHSGHMMFANKKITPGGHWMGITAIACKISHADAIKSAKAYAIAAIAMFDSFISCWDEKYRSSVVRPVTVINEQIDHNWSPLLQTPPFPEYPSGHSTITRAAATVLTNIFGDNFAFLDTSNVRYIGLQRHFNSFIEAANEASISRLYGGIHYRRSVDLGALEGREVGMCVLKKLGM